MRIKLRKLIVTSAMALLLTLTMLVSLLKADTGTCGGTNINVPFTDVTGNGFFCQIAAAYFSGLTNGTSPTTYSPGNPVTREQMAAFITRTLDQSLKRGHQRAALGQFWTPTIYENLVVTTVGNFPVAVASDGTDVWVASRSGSVTRVRASDGKPLETWTVPDSPEALCIARGGYIYVAARDNGNNATSVYRIDPRQPAGQATLWKDNLGSFPTSMAFDGWGLWVVSSGGPQAGTIVRIGQTGTQTINSFAHPVGVLYDGANTWITESSDNTLKKLDDNGNVLLSVPLGSDYPGLPVFDGTNIWVPCSQDDKVVVVRAATGAIVANLTGNGLGSSYQAAFDGERVLVTNLNQSSASLWKATDLTPLGAVSLRPFLSSEDTSPQGVCSDGLHFWVALSAKGVVARL